MNRMWLRGVCADSPAFKKCSVLLLLFVIGIVAVYVSLSVYILVQYIIDRGYDPHTGVLANIHLLVLLQDFLVFMFPAIAGAWMFFSRPMSETLATDWRGLRSIIMGVLALFLLLPFVVVTEQWNAALELPQALHGVEEWMRNSSNEAKQMIESMLNYKGTQMLLLNLFIIAVMAGVSEELLFRGLLLRLLQQRAGGRVHLAVWLSAVIFSAFHLDVYGFLPRLILGGALGYIFVYCGLWASIVAHAAYNAMAVMSMQMPYNEGSPAAEELRNFSPSWWVVISTLLLSLLLFYKMRRRALTRQ